MAWPKNNSWIFRGCWKPFIHENLKCSNFVRQSKSWKQTIGSMVQTHNVTLVVFLTMYFNQAIILNTVYITSTLPFGHTSDVEIVQVNVLKVWQVWQFNTSTSLLARLNWLGNYKFTSPTPWSGGRLFKPVISHLFHWAFLWSRRATVCAHDQHISTCLS